MKRKLLFLFTVLFLTVGTIDVNAVVQKAHKHQHGNSVGAPLDGGLLVLLAAAGISYFGVRKKKITE